MQCATVSNLPMDFDKTTVDLERALPTDIAEALSKKVCGVTRLAAGGTAIIVKGTIVVTNKIVALKIFDERVDGSGYKETGGISVPAHMANELAVAAKVNNHPFIAKCDDAMLVRCAGSAEQPIIGPNDVLALIMEVMPMSLAQFLRPNGVGSLTYKDPEQCAETPSALCAPGTNPSAPRYIADTDIARLITVQIVLAVDFMHAHFVIHRDLTPFNILLDPETMLVKVSDFGSARQITQKDLAADGSLCTDLSGGCTLYWYRAIEVLLGSTKYGYPIDVWSLGCIIAELLCPVPIFSLPSKEMLGRVARKMLNVVGFPTKQSWPDAFDRKVIPQDILVFRPSRKEESEGSAKEQMLARARKYNPTGHLGAQQEASDLIEKCIMANPDHRAKVSDIMAHAWCRDILEIVKQTHLHA